MTKDDYVIICGDFGGVWNYEEETGVERYWLNWLNDKPFTTLFVDGNHENFDRLYSCPEITWNGGKVHKIRSSIFHLVRGEVFMLNGKKVFAFGGASSHDIQDGILDMSEEDRIYLYRKTGRYFRIRNFSWWEQELPSEEEMKNGMEKLDKADFDVDYVISHRAPTDVQLLLNNRFKTDILNEHFQELQNKLKFKRWFFGHYPWRKKLMRNLCVHMIA